MGGERRRRARWIRSEATTLPARSMEASQPRARNCSCIHAARSCFQKGGGGHAAELRDGSR